MKFMFLDMAAIYMEGEGVTLTLINSTLVWIWPHFDSNKVVQ